MGLMNELNVNKINYDWPQLIGERDNSKRNRFEVPGFDTVEGPDYATEKAFIVDRLQLTETLYIWLLFIETRVTPEMTLCFPKSCKLAHI